MSPHTAFFGDAERTFRLTPELLIELERLVGAGAWGIARRLFAGEGFAQEVRETVRLGLIGGGENPKRAQELVETYLGATGYSESYELATAIMAAAMTGAPEQEDAADAA